MAGLVNFFPDEVCVQSDGFVVGALVMNGREATAAEALEWPRIGVSLWVDDGVFGSSVCYLRHPIM